MSESPSTSSASPGADTPCHDASFPTKSVHPRSGDVALSAGLSRAARFARAGEWERAEEEILETLAGYTETELSAVYIGAIALVRDLGPAPDPVFVGPVLDPGVTDRVLPTRRNPPESGPRRDYAYAITTALRVRLNPNGPDHRRSAA